LSGGNIYTRGRDWLDFPYFVAYHPQALRVNRRVSAPDPERESKMKEDENNALDALRQQTEQTLGYILQSTTTELDASDRIYLEYHQKCVLYDNQLLGQTDVQIKSEDDVRICIGEKCVTPAQFEELLKESGIKVLSQEEYMGIASSISDSTLLASQGLVRRTLPILSDPARRLQMCVPQIGIDPETSFGFHIDRVHTVFGRFLNAYYYVDDPVFELSITKLVPQTTENSIGREQPLRIAYRLVRTSAQQWSDGVKFYSVDELAENMADIATSYRSE